MNSNIPNNPVDKAMREYTRRLREEIDGDGGVPSVQNQPPVTIRVAAPVRLPVQIRYVDERMATTPAWQPSYKTEGSAGFDLRALVIGIDPTRKLFAECELWPGEALVFGTGLAFAIPPGYELQIRGRSGMNSKLVCTLLGTVDSDYRGEVGLCMHNAGKRRVLIRAGDRLSQGVLAPVLQALFEPVDELPETARGAGGFGSTGVR